MSNHKAIVALVTKTFEIPSATNIQLAIVLGERVIVSKDVQVGHMGVLFPADLQLSEQYCHENNLYRHASMNKNIEKSGFFDDNRRVRCQPFLKVKSTAYFANLESLAYTGVTEFQLGASFDELNGIKICEKYYSKASREAMAKQNRPKAQKLNATPYFTKHFETGQWLHNAAMIPKGALLSFHSKVHGTSSRSAYTKVMIELPKWKQLVNKFASIFPTEKWDYVTGSRNVVLTNPDKEAFHGSEKFRFEITESLKPFMEKGMTVYGEVAGYVNGKPIMNPHNTKALKDKAFTKKYGDTIVHKYNCAEHEYRFHIYRISRLNHEGKNIDMSAKQVEQWAKERGFLSTFEVAPQEIYDGDLHKLMEKVEYLTERPDEMCADYVDPSIPSEGIIIRVDTGDENPYFLKSKSYQHRVLEGHIDAVDPEDIS